MFDDSLARFSAPTQAWFSSAFAEPTAPQSQGWPAISAGEHALICAPTGTGKTLAAFLWAIDRLMSAPADGAGAGAASPESGAGVDAPVAVLGGSDVVPSESAHAGLGAAGRRILCEHGKHGDHGASVTRVLYVSPLRALAVDVEKNLRAPLHGIGLAAERLGVDVHEPTVGVRTGDTPADQRRRMVRHPPEILITTPESLFLMLTSRARETLTGVEHVIIDEIHAVAGTKRGTHLMVSMERLEDLCPRPPQRIALSATQRPLSEIARFLGGFSSDSTGAVVARPVTVVDAAVRKELDVQVVVPVADMSSLGETVEAPLSEPATAGPARRSIWPAIHPRLLDLVESHRSTLIFANARGLSERLAARLNEMHSQRQALDEPGRDRVSSGADIGPECDELHDLDDPDRSAASRGDAGSVDGVVQGSVGPASAPAVAVGDEQVGTGAPPGEELVKAHHGSVSRQRRLLIEDELKRGELRGLVATSTLELGIDMGAVDLVVQVASPGSVASGLQRIGRAGHRVGEPSRGRIFPKHRADLLEAAAVVERMHSREVEQTRFLRNPLDVASQQIVAMCAMDDWHVDALASVLRRCSGFAELSDEVLHSVLDLLSGVYPAEEFSELRPRIVWDRASGMLRGRAGAQRLAVTNAGTIPDRGLFGVFLADGTRVGELDEEMVYESRVGETFLLGASTWRIVDITFERVVVAPAPGELAKMPFWHGDGPGRPVELGRAVGRLVRELRGGDTDTALARLREGCGLDEAAAQNLVAYLDDQAEATGAVPDDRTVVVERFRDEIGDWRVCVLTPFGARVHAPWAMALRTRLAEAWSVDLDLMWGDDGIVMRLPEAIDDLPVEDLLFDPDDIGDLVLARLPDTSMFASRFRECAARALLLPRRRPDQRTPLWQQRQRAADLLAVASRHPAFPILLEATRECVNDVFDLASLTELMRGLQARRIRMVAVDTPQASPFAQSLLFSWIAVYMYEGDAPLAERRAAALALDRDLLRDLLGAEELRELLDAGVIADVELELQRLAARWQARDIDGVHDLLRVLGPLTIDELVARSSTTPATEPPVDVAADMDYAAGRVGAPAGDVGSEAVGVGRRAGSVGVGSAAGGVGADASAAAASAGMAGLGVDSSLGSGAAQGARGDESRESGEAMPELRPATDRLMTAWVRTLVEQRRAVVVRLAGRDVVADAADSARLRDAAGVALPVGLPASATEPVDDPLGDLCMRFARSHGPFTARDVAHWLGVGDRWTAARLESLVSEGRLLRGEFRPGGAEREFCDADVLRRIRRRCLAVLRHEVEPVPQNALARFLPAWQGVGTVRRGVDALADVIAQLQGAPVAASVLEIDVLASRMAGYKPSDLDQLCTSGEVVWVGAGAVGATDGRVRLVFRDQAALLVPDAVEIADGALHDALRGRLRDGGASFWSDLVAAARAASLPYDTETVLAALWDLVWGGEVTNDSLAPLRARISRRQRSHGAAGKSHPPAWAGRSRRGRPRLGGLTATGPAAASGRWSLVEPLLQPAPTPTEAALARAHQLLDRYGVVTRETALGEGHQGGFAGVYPILKTLEERGDVRRGYFVAGLGAAQFALPGAVDRLRSARAGESAADPLVLAATDPGQPYGAALAWPASVGRPVRAAGAHVVLADGVPVVELERGGRSLVTFAGAEHDDAWIDSIIALVKDGRLPKLEIAKVDGKPIRDTPWAARLESAGFIPAYRGLLYRH